MKALEKKILLSINNIQPNLRVINLYQCPSGFDTGFRRLYAHYFLYVHKGMGVITIDNKAFYTLPGDLYFCPPGVPNRIVADVTDPFLLTGIDFDFTHNHQNTKLLLPIQAEAFNPSFLTETVSFKDFEGFPSRLSLHDNNSIREIILDMIRQFNTQKKYWENYTSALLHTFIIAVLQCVTLKDIGVNCHRRADELIGYLSKNYMQDLSNRQVARLFHYNSDYISKIVYSYTGLTLKQYIINLRIRAALNLLLNNDTQIKDIALQVGYSNIHYFTRVFKMKTGFSPVYFRRHMYII